MSVLSWSYSQYIVVAIPGTTHSCCWHKLTWSTSTPFCQHQSTGRLISTFPSSAADLFRLPPYRSGTHYQKQSFRHQLCGRSSTNWKLSNL